MCSYNTLCVCDGYPCSCPGPSHGIPACADHELLTTVLRDEWKSKAYVVSDAGAIKFTQTDHEYAAGQPEAAADALAAGADLALGETAPRHNHLVAQLLDCTVALDVRCTSDVCLGLSSCCLESCALHSESPHRLLSVCRGWVLERPAAILCRAGGSRPPQPHQRIARRPRIRQAPNHNQPFATSHQHNYNHHAHFDQPL